jgi:hypothetical protein
MGPIPVLLTSSVHVADQSVNLKNPSLRIDHTLESIEHWLTLCPNVRLVICDGSGFDFSRIVGEKFPRARIECLNFQNDKKMVAYHGKGYGEGEIIKYAIANSSHLADSDWFVKCTAKLWVDNFSACIKEWNGQFLCWAFFANVFSFKKTKFAYIDTRFYVINKNFYLKYFSDAHLEVGGPEGRSIEDIFREVVLTNGMQKVIFNTPPVICGVGGGSGKYYKTGMRRRIKEKLRARLVKLNPFFRPLINCD